MIDMNIWNITNAVVEACEDAAAWVNHVPLDSYVHDFSEEEMQAFCLRCWSSGVPLAHYGNKVVSYYTVRRENLPPACLRFMAGTFPPHNDYTVSLYEIRFVRRNWGWKNHNKLIGEWMTLKPYSRTEDFLGLPNYAPCAPDSVILSRQSEFYDRAKNDWASGEDLCKYADLLRYLGECYAALEWYKKSDAAGFAWAAYNIGDYYAASDGNKNESEAKRWFSRAAELGLPEAQHRLNTPGE